MTIIWFTLAVSTSILALWPFGFYQMSLMLATRLYWFKSVPQASGMANDLTFAVCVAAYNEAGCIEAKIDNLLDLRRAAGGQLDILVYVDGASDGTADLLRAYGDQIELIVSPERHGKTSGMNQLVAATNASIILFTDANVTVQMETIDVLRPYFADPTVGCVCANLVYVNAESSATSEVGGSYWALNEWSKGLETATGSVIGADGSLFAVRGSLHRPVPNGLIDDIWVSFDILFQGFRVVRAPELQVFEQHTTEPMDEFRRKIRIACECMHVHRASWPQWRQQSAWNLYKYIAHRVLRWLGGYFLLLSALFTFFGLVSSLGLGVALGLVVTGLVGFGVAVSRAWRPAMALLNVLLAFAGTSIGVYQAWRGKRAITWNVASSARGDHPVRVG